MGWEQEAEEVRLEVVDEDEEMAEGRRPEEAQRNNPPMKTGNSHL